jgi:hypothetical protein
MCANASAAHHFYGSLFETPAFNPWILEIMLYEPAFQIPDDDLAVAAAGCQDVGLPECDGQNIVVMPFRLENEKREKREKKFQPSHHFPLSMLKGVGTLSMCSIRRAALALGRLQNDLGHPKTWLSADPIQRKEYTCSFPATK